MRERRWWRRCRKGGGGNGGGCSGGHGAAAEEKVVAVEDLFRVAVEVGEDNPASLEVEVEVDVLGHMEGW